MSFLASPSALFLRDLPYAFLASDSAFLRISSSFSILSTSFLEALLASIPFFTAFAIPPTTSPAVSTTLVACAPVLA